MRVVIPVAGAGTRLRPHTYARPKPLLTVAGKPILAHILDPLANLKPDEVIFVVGYKGDQIEKFVTSNYTFAAKFVQQDELLGLGYAINLALEQADVTDGPLFVVLGDTITECDLASFTAAGDYVLGVRKVDDPRRFGIAEIRDGHVASLQEKPADPRGNLALIGLYYFADAAPLRRALNTHVSSGNTTRGEIQLTDALSLMIHDGIKFLPYEVHDWYDCGKPETMLSTNAYLLDSMQPRAQADGSIIIPPVYLHVSAKVTGSIVGPHVSVSESAEISNSIISNSIIGAQAHLASVILKDSIIGDNVHLTGRERRLNIGDSSQVDCD